MKRYRKERGGKIQWTSEVHPHKYYLESRLADLKETRTETRGKRRAEVRRQKPSVED
jgi:hypothetical protein